MTFMPSLLVIERKISNAIVKLEKILHHKYLLNEFDLLCNN